MSEQPQIPEGYWQDANGALHHESLIKPIDKTRDALVRDLFAKARALQAAMVEFKAAAFGDIEAFIELSAEQYGANLGGKKGNVQLMSFDGSLKIQRAIAESIAFDERLQAAKALIDECLHEWTKDARPELLTLVNDAFRVDQKGDIRTARVLALRRLDIDDPRWKQAMLAIGEACQVIGSKAYVRFYERSDNSDVFRAVSLDIASV